jgi:hypothetical protein
MKKLIEHWSVGIWLAGDEGRLEDGRGGRGGREGSQTPSPLLEHENLGGGKENRPSPYIHTHTHLFLPALGPPSSLLPAPQPRRKEQAGLPPEQRALVDLSEIAEERAADE